MHWCCHHAEVIVRVTSPSSSDAHNGAKQLPTLKPSQQTVMRVRLWAAIIYIHHHYNSPFLRHIKLILKYSFSQVIIY